MTVKKHLFSAILLGSFVLPLSLQAGDLRISLPKRSKPTPVQQLNQDGVRAVKKGQIDKAQKLFYRAYLLDPDDPYTLNNLGYIAELQGNAERAEKFYELASRQGSESVIADASVSKVKGKTFGDVTQSFGNHDLEVNRGNVQAMSLLSQGRVAEARAILQRTLAVNPKDPFTLNNLAYAFENEGDLSSAYQYYLKAADIHSFDKIVVSADKKWRGKPISEVAEKNARAVHDRIENEQSVPAQVARLNQRGVSALNRNEPQEARGYFEQAYKLDPHNAFSLNNMGYVAEMNGDEETAQEFYLEAGEANGAIDRVGLATQRNMQGLSLGQVASANSNSSDQDLAAERESRRRQGGEIRLKQRNGAPIPEPAVVPDSNGATPQTIPPQQSPAAPLPSMPQQTTPR